MINERSIKAIEASCFGPFRKPLYGSYCFSRIPDTVRLLLTGERARPLPDDTFIDKKYDKVLVILLDAFGWELFERYKSKYPFLQRFVEQGIASKITSQFPSTTTNHITCIHTGLEVGQSGLYEWFLYEPLVDSCICPLRYSFAKDKSYNTLFAQGVQPEELFPFRTIYQELQDQGIHSFTYQDKDSAKSPYSQTMYQGSELFGYKNLREGLLRLAHNFNREGQKGYYFLYFSEIDGAGHEFGPHSEQIAHQIDKCLIRLEQFWQEITTKKQNSCIIVTADHGMAQIRPENTWFLNKMLPQFERYMVRNLRGELLVPCGSSRDMHLHILPEHLDEAHRELTEALNGIAACYKTEELISMGLFGLEPPSERFLDRVGNLVILPFGTNSVWWYEPGLYENPYHGHHGGLSPQEIESIFLFQEL